MYVFARLPSTSRLRDSRAPLHLEAGHSSSWSRLRVLPFIRPPVSRHLGCLQIGVVTSKATEHVLVRVPFWTRFRFSFANAQV